MGWDGNTRNTPRQQASARRSRESDRARRWCRRRGATPSVVVVGRAAAARQSGDAGCPSHSGPQRHRSPGGAAFHRAVPRVVGLPGGAHLQGVLPAALLGRRHRGEHALEAARAGRPKKSRRRGRADGRRCGPRARARGRTVASLAVGCSVLAHQAVRSSELRWVLPRQRRRDQSAPPPRDHHHWVRRRPRQESSTRRSRL
mmetsp:Transcript_20105/g.80199  ORF Transcript_20105/g.80199 Transcript_20105/m.80199 type:complete len:201 (-) Transcript_20105:792-1394(-)